ncbi:MAG TPA: hypothetical protein VNS58_02200 [Puia sp.]|nr:hypothetical protein [Puia sp.]
MHNYSINILSEKSPQFSAGNVYLVQSKIELTRKELFTSSNAFYLNYAFDEAQKVVPSFESLKIDEQKRVVASIQKIYGFKIRVDDLFGKLLVVLFFNMELYDLLIVGLLGLGDSSIETFTELVKKMIKKKCKVIILTKTAPELHESVSVATL